MSMFDLKGGSGNGWNYSDNTKANYMEMIEGTVVEISNPQALNFATRQPEFWPDGNPKRNLMLSIRGRSGQELTWTIAPRSKGAEACLAALDPQGTREKVSIEEMLGKFVRVQTQAGNYNSQNPRPWWVTILGDGEVNMVRGLKDLSQPERGAMPGMPAPQPAPQPAYQQPAPPVAQAPAPMPPVQQGYANNYEAAKAKAAQSLGFQQNAPAAQPPVEQVPVSAYENPGAGVYDSDIPF